MQGFQLKIDFGEGSQAQEAYEKFLESTGREDTSENWASFQYAWIAFTKADRGYNS